MYVFEIVVTVWKTGFRDEQPWKMTLIHYVFAILLTVWKTGFKDEQPGRVTLIHAGLYNRWNSMEDRLQRLTVRENDYHACMPL